MENKKYRKFIISWNNYPPTLSLEDLKETFLNFAMVEYLIMGFEQGEEKHTPHIQGYIRFTNPQYFENVRKLLKNEDGTFGFLQIANGTDEENQKYCSKQDNYIEYGTPNENKKNKNENIKNIIDDIITNMDFIELCKKYNNYVLYHYRDFIKLYNDIRNQVILKNLQEQNNKTIENGKDLFGKELKIE